MTPKAALIAIGTEVSSGEIINSNASWLAAKLDSCGVDVVLHLAVADDRQSILDALNFAAARAPLILTIGGLGPTTDDFTRDVITDWAGLKKFFDEPSWQRIEDRFQKLGRTAPASNRQQCFFPEGARILLNSQGSANGFSINARNVTVTVLPGPPRELQAIWNDHLEKVFRDLAKNSDKPTLRTWACLGVPESTLAEKVEALMAGSNLQLGYRASAPVVHVKVWIPKGAEKTSAPFIEKLDKTLEPFCIARDGADHLQKLKSHLAARRDTLDITLHDSVTGGLLASRIADLLRPLDIPFTLTSTHHHPDAPRCHSEAKPKNPLFITLSEAPVILGGAKDLLLTITTPTRSTTLTYPDQQLPSANDALQTTRTRLLLTERVLIDLGKFF